MPIPELGADGRLPDGVYECTLEEIRNQFGSFQRTDWRPQLFRELQIYVDEATRSGVIQDIYVNGSFVTGKEEPGDIDLLVILPADYDPSPMARPAEYNVRSARMVRKRHRGMLEILTARDGSPAADDYATLFRRVKGEPGAYKGYLKVQL